MNRIAIVCLVAAAALSSNALAAEPEAPLTNGAAVQDLKSRIGRVRSKAEEAWGAFTVVSSKRILTFVTEPTSERPYSELQTIYRDLYYGASATNKVSQLVCMDSVTASLCGPVFDPKWRVFPKDANPTMESLAEWTKETEIAIEPLWQGICKLLAEKTANAQTCQQSV